MSEVWEWEGGIVTSDRGLTKAWDASERLSKAPRSHEKPTVAEEAPWEYRVEYERSLHPGIWLRHADIGPVDHEEAVERFHVYVGLSRANEHLRLTRRPVQELWQPVMDGPPVDIPVEN
jgi:hypothetical protein